MTVFGKKTLKTTNQGHVTAMHSHPRLILVLKFPDIVLRQLPLKRISH